MLLFSPLELPETLKEGETSSVHDLYIPKTHSLLKEISRRVFDDNRAFTFDALSPFLPADMLFVTLSLLNPESINSTSPTHSSSVDSSWRVCKLYIANAQPFSWDTAISFISPAIRKR